MPRSRRLEDLAARGRTRSVVAWALVVVWAVAAATGLAGMWLRGTALDTERYLDTVAPLPQDPAVSAALAHVVVDQVYQEVDIEQSVRRLLPNELDFLAAPIGRSVHDVSVDHASRIISSDAFQGVWESLNRVGHTRAVALLTGRGAVVLTEEGAVAWIVSPNVVRAVPMASTVHLPGLRAQDTATCWLPHA